MANPKRPAVRKAAKKASKAIVAMDSGGRYPDTGGEKTTNPAVNRFNDSMNTLAKYEPATAGQYSSGQTSVKKSLYKRVNQSLKAKGKKPEPTYYNPNLNTDQF